MREPLDVFCRYCLAAPGEPCRSHLRPLAEPPEPVKHPHIERVISARTA